MQGVANLDGSRGWGLAESQVGCQCLVFLVVPEDGREASRVERGLVGVVISSIVVSRVVAVGRVVARVVVSRGIHRIPSVAKSKVFLLKDTTERL